MRKSKWLSVRSAATAWWWMGDWKLGGVVAPAACTGWMLDQKKKKEKTFPIWNSRGLFTHALHTNRLWVISLGVKDSFNKCISVGISTGSVCAEVGFRNAWWLWRWSRVLDSLVVVLAAVGRGLVVIKGIAFHKIQFTYFSAYPSLELQFLCY